MAGRDLNCTDQGVVNFFEAIGGGSNKIGVRAPAAVAADFDIELLTALPGVTSILTIDSAGQLGTTAVGAGDLDDSYDFPTAGAGRIVTVSDGAIEFNSPAASGNIALLATQADNFDVLQVTKTAIGAGVGLVVTNAGTGIGVKVNQNLAAGTQDGLLVQNLGTGAALGVDQDGDGFGVNIQIDAASTKAGVNLLNAGTGAGVLLTQSGNAKALDVIVGAASTVQGIDIANAGTGNGMRILQNGASGIAVEVSQGVANNAVVKITKTSAGGGNVLDLSNAGSAPCIDLLQTGAAVGLLIDQNGNGTALSIDSEATTAAGINVDLVAGNSSPGINVLHAGTGAGLLLDQNGNGIALSIDSEATTAAGISVALAGTGNGLFLNQDGNGIALNIDSEATGQPLINLQPLDANTRGDIAFSALRAAEAASPSEGDMWYRAGREKLRFQIDGLQINVAAPFFGQNLDLEDVTISTGGTATITTGRVRLTSFSGTADDLDDIQETVGRNVDVGEIIYLQAVATHTITVKHDAGGVSNIRLDGAVDKVLNAIFDVLALQKVQASPARFAQVAFSNNGGE